MLAYPPHHNIAERVFFGLLAAATILGIGYGFSCLVDLVQNWALFGAGIERLVQ